MPLIITKNGDRNFSHSDGFKTVNVSTYDIVLDETDNTVIITFPNGGRFPHEVVPVANVTVVSGVDSDTYPTVDLLRARLVVLGYPPFVEATEGGAVDSVNGFTGTVVLDADDISDATTTNKFVTSAEKSTWNAKEPAITAGTTSQYYRGDKTFQTLDKSAVGLGNVDNTSDANKPVSTATQTALDLKANLASPTFTGTPSAPTPNANDNSTKIATTAYVDSKKTRIFLTADITNSTVADADVTGFTFTLPASTKCDFRVCLPFTSAATGTGINVGVKIVTGVGANGNVLGNVLTKTRLSTSTVGWVVNVVEQGANATVSYSALSGVSTAGLTNVVELDCDLTNLATNTSATIQIVFASEVASSAVDVKKGSSMVINI